MNQHGKRVGLSLAPGTVSPYIVGGQWAAMTVSFCTITGDFLLAKLIVSVRLLQDYFQKLFQKVFRNSIINSNLHP